MKKTKKTKSKKLMLHNEKVRDLTPVKNDGLEQAAGGTSGESGHSHRRPTTNSASL